MKTIFIFLSLMISFTLFAGPKKKKDILDNYFSESAENKPKTEATKTETTKTKEKNWDFSSVVKKEIRKDPNKKEDLFYNLTIAPDKYSLTNRFYMSYEGFDLPVTPFIGADFYHLQDDEKFSGIAVGAGAIFNLFNYSTVSSEAPFRQTIEYWSVPRNNLKISGITRSTIGVNIKLEATKTFKMFFGVELSNVWAEGSALASIPSDIRENVARSFNYSYGILLRI